MSPPRTPRSFLGLASYYRRFVENFSTIAAPLSDLTRNDRPDKVVWTVTEENAFVTLKEKLSSEPVLRGPDFSREFVLQTDAPDVGLGAVLSQVWDGESYSRGSNTGPPWIANVWPLWRGSGISRST